MTDYLPWEFDVNADQEEWFECLKRKYKSHRAQVLPKEYWQPLIEKWLKEHPDPDLWFVLHVNSETNVSIYETALTNKGFTFSKVINRFHNTPTYLETPLNGLNADQSSMLTTIKDMENRNGVLYYRNVPAPVVDLLYEEVFEERLVYPERFV